MLSYTGKKGKGERIGRPGEAGHLPASEEKKYLWMRQPWRANEHGKREGRVIVVGR